MRRLILAAFLLNFGGKSLQQESASSESLSLMWTGRYLSDDRTTVSKLSRDPREVGQTNFPFVDVFVDDSGALGAIESDSQRRRIFFQNFENNFIGVHYMDSNVTQQYFGGMAKDVEELAYDWKSGNLYWTDSERQLIMVVDSTLAHYSVLLPLQHDYKPSGLAIHSDRRLLFFSVRSLESPMIWVCDLSGANPQPILTYPSVDVVTSLSVDGNNLYWLDLFASNFKVQTSNLDGSNVRTLFSRKEGSFEGIAAYKGVVYVTDAYDYFDTEGVPHHKMYMLTTAKTSMREFRINEKPRKVTFYKNESVDSGQGVLSHGECNIPGQAACDHICLPRLNDSRTCACAVGYRKVGETRCVADPLGDNVLIIADDVQKKIFQLSLTGDVDSYQTLPIASEFDRKVMTMALNQQNKAVYWSDQTTTTIYKLPFNSNRPVVVKTGMHAHSMAVDPITGNVYFFDAETRYIYVMNADGQYLKTLMRPTRNNGATIRKMQVDFVNRFLYWLEPAPVSFKKGRIRRMPLSGGEPEVVVSGLLSRTWSFDINYDSQSLFYNHYGNSLIEVPLSSLPIVHRKAISTGRTSQHHLDGFKMFSDKFFDFKVDDGSFYITKQDNSNVVKYNPANGNPLFVYQNAFFFHPAWLEVYRPAYYQKHSALVSKSCTNTVCRQLCFVAPDRRQVCDCEDNRRLSGRINCIATSGNIDLPPVYGDSCPSNSHVSLLPCQNEIPLNIRPPRWTDDNTAPGDLKLAGTFINSSYPAGSHFFLFTAEDSAGHLSYCTFTITITATTCAFRFKSRVGNVITRFPKCSNGEYIHEFACANAKQRLYFEGSYFKTLRNICQRDGTWRFPSAQELICAVPPTSSTSSTTTTKEPRTTTALSTTGAFATTTTGTTTTTTKQPSIRTKTITSTLTTKSTIKKTSERSKVSVAAGVTSRDSLEGHTEKLEAIIGAEPQSDSSGLSGGLVAVVVVICVVVLTALLVGLIVVARRKYLVPLSDNNNGFRLFWNTAEEDVTKESSDSDGFSLPA